MLDRRDLPGDAGDPILFNLYSDHGLGSTNNSALWNSGPSTLEIVVGEFQHGGDVLLFNHEEEERIFERVPYDDVRFMEQIRTYVNLFVSICTISQSA